ncbi:hypothetical protein D3C71_1122600 [compost metagenome]
MAGHDHALHDRRRRGDGDIAGGAVAHADGDVDLAVVAEARARLAGRGIDRDQAAIQGAFDDAGGAGAARHLGQHRHATGDGKIGGDIVHRGVLRGSRHFVVGDATAGRGVRNGLVLDLGVVAPALGTVSGIERDQLVARGAQVQAVADFQRRGFRAPALLRQITGAEQPGLLKLAHVVRGDLLQWREARGGIVAAIGGPVAIHRAVGRLQRRIGGRCQAGAGHRFGERALGGRDAVRHEGQGEGGDEHQREHAGDAARYLARDRTIQRRQQQRQHEADGHDQAQPRHPAPVIAARLPPRPQQRADEHQREPQRAAVTAPPQLNAGDQQADTGQHVVPGTPEAGQPGPARGEHDSQQQNDNCQHSHQPMAAVAGLRRGGHRSLLKREDRRR